MSRCPGMSSSPIPSNRLRTCGPSIPPRRLRRFSSPTTAAVTSGRASHLPTASSFIAERDRSSQSTPEDTELVSARWSGGQFTLGDVIGAGRGRRHFPDGHRVFFLRPPDTSQMSALWVKDLDTPSPAVKLWDRVFFPAHHIDTWAPLGQSVVWAPNGSTELFFVRQVPSTAPVSQVVRATIAADLTATIQVLATNQGEDRFSDLAVSADGRFVALVVSNRRPYRGGKLVVVDLSHPDAEPRVVLDAPEGAQLYVRGWTPSGAIVVLRSFRPDLSANTEISRSAEAAPRSVWPSNRGGSA